MKLQGRTLPVVVAVAILALIGAGIALSGGDDAGSALSPPAAVAPEATTTEPATTDSGETEAGQALALDGPKLPDVQATAAGGQKVDFGALRGPAVIHVYASWCSVCRAEAEGFSQALRSAPGVKPIYVAVEDRPADSAAFAKSYQWPKGATIDDPDRSLASKLGVNGQPNTILVDAEGRTKTIVGASSTAQLKAVLQALSA